jgi:hypothetical protein
MMAMTMKMPGRVGGTAGVQVHSVGAQGMPAQAPSHTPAGGASDPDGARRHHAADGEHDHEVSAQPHRAAMAHAYTAAGRAVSEPPEDRPGISVLA